MSIAIGILFIEVDDSGQIKVFSGGKRESVMAVKSPVRLASLLVFTTVSAVFYSYVQASGFRPRHSQVYGDVISRNTNLIKNAVIENITLYPRKGFHSRERIARKALFILPKNAKGTVLVSHGFMCDKYDSGFLRSLFPYYNCMTFDMRAHGEDTDGQICTLGRDEALDVTAAARFLRNHPNVKGKPLIVYGFSMGAVAAIEAQAKDSTLFDAMILDCPFDASESIVKTSLDHVKFSLFGYEFSIPGRSLLEKYVFHPYVQSLVKVILKTVARMNTRNINMFIYPIYPAESIKKISAPMLLIHCKNDEKVPVTSIKRIYKNAASTYKKLWITAGRRHYDSYFYNPEEYTRRVRKFAGLAVSGELITKKREKIIEYDENKSISVHVNIGDVQARGK